MNIVSNILRWIGLGGVSNSDTGDQVGSGGSIATDAGINVTDERALQVSSVWACVQYITNSVCSLPIGFYTKEKEGRKELEDHYLNDLFHVSPNSLMKPRDLRKALTMQLCLWQNAYAEIVWNSAGTRPIAIIPLRPGRMIPHITKDGLVYHYATEDGVRIYAKKSILHLKGFGSDGVVGFTRVDYARKALGLAVSADVYAAKQFANGGNSGSGWISFDTFLTAEQREQAKKLYEGFHETAYNKGRARILEGGAKWNETGLNPDSMQMIETRKMQIGEIARYFGVPEVLIGGGGATSAWPSSFEQQLLSFLTFTLQDYLDEWEHAIKDSLLIGQDKKKIIIDHDVSGFIKMDSVAKSQLHASWVQNGIKTRNEIRKINNDPAVQGADDLTVQVNLTPVSDLEKVNDSQTI